MSDYIEVNNEITYKTLADRETEGVIESHVKRYNEEYQLFSKYVKPHMSVLDLGCKDGMWFDILSAYGFRNLTGIDCSPVVLEMIGAKGYDAYLGDITKMPMFTDKSFDAISCIHTLEHVPEPEKVVQECKRIVKENGYVFIEIPTQEYAPPEDWGHYHCFSTKQELIDMFNKDFELLETISQPTKSKSPWHRFMFKVRSSNE